jgi:TP901 family phage tail tape measure protein
MPGGKIDILVDPDLQGFDGKLAAGLRTSSSALSKFGAGIGLAVTAGVGIAAVGLKNVIKLGTDYQNNLNQIQAVSGATGDQMAAVSAKAIALGNDLSLPATSAADAAQAMLELAKGGLTVDQAMQAAKGTLQLAAAAQISGAQAAEIQANALNSFGLKAADAGHVADVLANTANQSSGDITDFAQALAQTGAVAHQFGISIDDTSTALGLLANAGIKGSDAGTLLKTALTQLAAPSKPAAAAIKDLGLKVFDARGQFVGLQSIMAQLHDASGRMTQAQYAQATATVFGTDAVRLAGVAAQDTSADWTKMSQAVSKAGGASQVAQAQMKGLGGAVQGFQSTLETIELQIFQVIAPAAEAVVREGTTVLSTVGQKAVTALQDGVKAAQLFGPQVADAIKSRAAQIGQEAEELGKPIVEGLRDATAEAVAIVVTYVKDVEQAGSTVAKGLEPVAKAAGDVAKSLDKAGGPLRTAGTLLGVVGDGAKAAAGLVHPLAVVVGDVVHAFSDLPGPVQTAVTALVALRVGPSILSGLKSALSGAASSADDAGKKTGIFGKSVSALTLPVRATGSAVTGVVSTVRQFSDEMRVQQALAAASGESIGKMGAAAAAFNTSAIPAVRTASEFVQQTRDIQAGAAAAGSPISTFGAALGTLVERSPALSQMRDSFRSAADGAQRFGGLAGTAAAAGTGLKLAAGGLVSALGGPFGIAVAGASLLLGNLASKQEAAAQAAAEHKRDVSDLAGSLDQTTGAVTEQTRRLQANKNATDGVNEAASRQGLQLGLLLDAQTGNAEALGEVNSQLREQTLSWLENTVHIGDYKTAMDAAGLTTNDFVEAAVGNKNAIDKVSHSLGQMSVDGQTVENPLNNLWSVIQNGNGDFNKLGTSIGAANDNLSEAQKRVNQTAQAMGTTSENASGLIDDFGKLSDSEASAADRASALKDALDRLNGGKIDQAQAQAQLNQTILDFNSALKQGVDESAGFGKALLNTDGSINTTTQNGQKLQQFAHDLSGNMSDLAAQTFKVSQANGDTLAQSFSQVSAQVAKTRTAFITAAEQMGLNSKEANKLADAYGLIPTQVATLVTTQGSAPQTQREVQGVIDKINGVHDRTVTVKSLTAQAAAQLSALGFQVLHLPDGSVTVTAQDHVTTAVNKVIAKNNGRKIFLSLVTGEVRAQGTSVVARAQGGIIEAYAAGGIRPMKGGYAQIVAPKTMRLIGDRVVDDESYIPINRSLRSAQILAETATRMGYSLIRRYAAGGIASAANGLPVTTAAGPTINNNVTVRKNEDAYTVAQTVSAQTAWQLRTRRSG